MEQARLAALIRRDFPDAKGRRIDDEALIEAVYSAATSGSARVLQFLSSNGMTVGVFKGFVTRLRLNSQAANIHKAVEIAKDLHMLDMLVAAETDGIPIDRYGDVRVRQMETIERKTEASFLTDEALRLESGRERIRNDSENQSVANALAAAIETNRQEQKELDNLQQKMSDTLLEIERLEGKGKLSFSESELLEIFRRRYAYDKANFNERTRKGSIQETDRKAVGPDEEEHSEG